MVENGSQYIPPEKEKPVYVDWGLDISHPVEEEALDVLGKYYGIEVPYKTTEVIRPADNKPYELLSINRKLSDLFSGITRVEAYQVLWEEVSVGVSFSDEQKDTLGRIVNEYITSFVLKKE